jgi:hypothetical protein
MARGPRTRSLVVLCVALATIAAMQTGAHARQVTVGAVCIERDAVSFEGRGSRVRDLVDAPKKDPIAKWVRRHTTQAERAAARVSAARAVTVPVWFHVIRKDLTVEGGNLPKARIDAQIDVLNDSFSGATGGVDSGFRFELRGITRTTNGGWFHVNGYGTDRAMKEALRRGGSETLNIYSAKLGANLLGYAYLASDYDEVGVLDGVVVHYQSLPPRRRRRSVVRPAATRVPVAVSIRSRTSWTTRRTAACSCSRRDRPCGCSRRGARSAPEPSSRASTVTCGALLPGGAAVVSGAADTVGRLDP